MKPNDWLSFVRARPKLWAIVGIVVAGMVALGAGLATGTWRTVCYDCPSIAQIYVWEPDRATKIFSEDGRLIAELAQEHRTPVVIDDLPEYVPQAFVAVEDKRFYRHNGFDYIGIVRAAIKNLMQFRIAAGGSTITQQLARNMFIQEVGFARQVERKLKEAKVARELEQVYSKEEILQAYINQINFGHGWYGIETAAQRYFGKHARDINPAEAAMLAGVINLPGRYSPFRNPDLARSRRNLVLGLMADQGILSDEEKERWRQHPLPERPQGQDDGEIAPYFVEWVREELDDRYGSDLYRKGFRIYTTLDIELQERARTAMENGWQRMEEQPGFRHPTYDEVQEDGTSGGSETPYVQGAFVAMDPKTGAVRALVGGRDFDDSKFNRAVQAKRQPGSVFKPFVYTAAISNGIPPSHVIYDAPLMLEQQDGTTWSPRNYTGQFHGPLTLREALRRSINVVAVKLGLEVGLETVAQYASRLGISTPVPRFAATSIGAAEVIPLDVVGAYSTFANQGVRVEPQPVRRVEDADGRILWEAEPEKEEVLDPLTAHIVRDMMRDVVDRGTGHVIRRENGGNLPYSIPAAGKTGTTNDATDVWFVGYTPNMVAGVWFGFDRPQKIIARATGGGYAAPVWAEFMREVYLSDPPLLPTPVEEAWPRPGELVSRQVDSESGKLATEWCPREQVYGEMYRPGTEPTEACDLHGPGLSGASLQGLAPEPEEAPADSQAADSIRPDSTRPDTMVSDTTAPDTAARDTSDGGR